MAYAKFDDPSKKVSAAPRKVYDAFPVESIRRALASVMNRVVFGTDGTSNLVVLAGCGTGGDSTASGIGCTAGIRVIVNGRMGTRGSAGNYALPSGTQGTGTYVKYLISGPINSTAGTVTAGNESTSSTGAYLPDLPDGHVALGYMEYVASSTCGWNRDLNKVANQTTSGSAGTFTFVDLANMPLQEDGL
jgi:hypothetical protein